MTQIDLVKGISIQVEGEEGRFNTISIPNLVKLAESLQELIFAVAKFDLNSQGSFDKKNYVLELSGFKKGSAVPQFQLTQKTQMQIINTIDLEREELSKKVDNLFSISNTGDYNNLVNEYPLPIIRNEIVEKLYGFTNSLVNTPLNIVNVNDDGSINKIYKIKRFNTDLKNKLIVKNVDILNEIDESKIYSRVGTISVNENKKGKSKFEIKELYQKSVNPSFAPEYLIGKNKSFTFKYPLLSLLYKEEGEYYIKNDILGILGVGSNEDEAERDFALEFTYMYDKLKSYPDDKLSDSLKMVKFNILSIIDKVEEI